MAGSLDPTDPDLRKRFYRLYRDFFDRAERKRRWSVAEDIPWDKASRATPAAIADIVETFCGVEMYLPDYVGQALPMLRANRGWAWFHVNWGYEESKHSLALGDWLVRSGWRTEEQMDDLASMVLSNQWQLPMDSPSGMLIYAMAQELATWLHYRRLRAHVNERDDPALTRLLDLIAIDERAHHVFYRGMVQIFLELDRETTLEQLRRVLNGFSMPAVHLLAQSQQRESEIRSLELFNEEIFFREVYQPILAELGVSRQEMRRTTASKSGNAG